MRGDERLRRRCTGLLVLVSALAAGCSSKAPPAGTTAIVKNSAPPIAQTSTEESDQEDPCSLLEPREVEAVFGAPLAVPPYRASSGQGPAADGDACVYRTADFHSMELSVTFTGGTMAFSMVNMGKKLLGGAPDPSMHNAIKESFKLDDGTELSGEWDEATLTPMNCCIFNALRSDQLIQIDFTGSDATLRQAATLVDSAFKRIDKPLKIDGGASVAAAAELEKRRVKPVDPCTLLTRAEVENLIGKLSADPVSEGTDGCSYQLPRMGNIGNEYEVRVTWRGGYYKWRSDSHVADIGTHTVAKMSEDVAERMGMEKGKAESGVNEMVGNKDEAASDAWDHAGVEGNHFVAVKKDVLVSVGLGPLTKRSAARDLVAAIMRKI
jgi:hypothetical protein